VDGGARRHPPRPTFAGCHSASHLTDVGLAAWIVADRNAYVRTALSWADDLPRLANLRQGLRDRIRRSPLCDHPRFARNLATAFRQRLADLPVPPPTRAHEYFWTPPPAAFPQSGQKWHKCGIAKPLISFFFE
jgi:hypothetical protein